jgi:hypothetical protein
METKIEFSWNEEFKQKVAFWAKSLTASLVGAMDAEKCDRRSVVFGLDNFTPIIKRGMEYLLEQIQNDLNSHVQERVEE